MKTKVQKYVHLIKLCTIICTMNACSVWQKIPDDTKHFAAGAAVTGITTTITYKLSGKKGLSLATGFVTGVAIGWGKEYIWDKQWNRGVCNVNDFYVTAWGSTVMIPSIFCVRDWREKKLYYRLDSATFNKFFVDTTKIK